MTPLLILFTRFPEANTTKTRLIPRLGAAGAARLQQEMTEYTVLQARKTQASIEIRYTGGSMDQMREWLGSDLDYVDQGVGDLGQRMARAFNDHFDRGATRVVLVGSDCPSNGWENMAQAFHALAKNDCVIGPASDGGYYLIGLSQPAPTLFKGIEWGSEQVFKQTILAACGRSVVTLRTLRDVDHPKDIPPKISVIIPTLNEEAHLAQTLAQVATGFNIESVVVDGGSTDQTQSVAETYLVCSGGRAAQQNLGAANTRGELLLFLHADTLLPDGWDWMIRNALAQPNAVLGAFLFKADEDFRGKRFVEFAANWRSKKRQLPLGDQGFFLHRKIFDAVGGFPNQPIMEEYALARTLRRKGKVIIVPAAVTTSSRRWKKHGVVKVTLINQLLFLGYHLGLSPKRLAQWYRK